MKPLKIVSLLFILCLPFGFISCDKSENNPIVSRQKKTINKMVCVGVLEEFLKANKTKNPLLLKYGLAPNFKSTQPDSTIINNADHYIQFKQKQFKIENYRFTGKIIESKIDSITAEFTTEQTLNKQPIIGTYLLNKEKDRWMITEEQLQLVNAEQQENIEQ